MYFVVFTVFSLRGQENVMMYNDYLSDNFYAINPAFAGMKYAATFRLSLRRQWFDVDNAPNFSMASLHARTKRGNSGVGVTMFTDNNGNQKNTGIKLTYAYHIRLTKRYIDTSLLSFGMNFSTINTGLDESSFGNSGIIDPSIIGVYNDNTYYNIDFGTTFHFFEFYAYYSMFNILETPRPNSTSSESNKIRRHLLLLGYLFTFNDLDYEPSILYYYDEYNSTNFLEYNIKMYKQFDRRLENLRIWGGFSFKKGFGDLVLSQNIGNSSILFGAKYKRFLLSYTYSTSIFNVNLGGSFHQLTLGFYFLDSLVPYKCNCPGLKN